MQILKQSIFIRVDIDETNLFIYFFQPQKDAFNELCLYKKIKYIFTLENLFYNSNHRQLKLYNIINLCF